MKNMRAIKQWQKVKTKLTELQTEERLLRQEICKDILGDKLEGATTIKEGDVKVTATAVLTRSLDQAALETLWDGLSWEEQQCVEYKPKLILSKYKPFEATESKLLDAITVKPGMAQLKVTV